MASWGFSARTVVEEHAAEESAREIGKHFSRFDEAIDALHWLLARSCEELATKKRTVDGVTYHLFRCAGDSVAGTPDITVLFTYDDNEVVILDVAAEEAENGE